MVKHFNAKVKLKSVTENEINNKTCFIIIMGDWLANLVFKNSLKYQSCIFLLICCIYIFLFDFFFLKRSILTKSIPLKHKIMIYKHKSICSNNWFICCCLYNLQHFCYLWSIINIKKERYLTLGPKGVNKKKKKGKEKKRKTTQKYESAIESEKGDGGPDIDFQLNNRHQHHHHNNNNHMFIFL